MASNIYEFRFSGSYLGGKAIVKAINKDAAWELLKKEWPNLETLGKCRVKEIFTGMGLFILIAANIDWHISIKTVQINN